MCEAEGKGPWAERRPTEEELQDVLEKHREWSTSGGRSGERADLSHADLTGAELEGAILNSARFTSGILESANLASCHLSFAKFVSAQLNYANLRGARLEGARFNNASLFDARLRNANLRGADFRRADLRGADLKGAVLANARLEHADLEGADLENANLEGASLEDADLRRANLLRARVIDANLSRTDLSDVLLAEAELRNTVASKVLLARARIGATAICVQDLSTAQGLEAISHFGPSPISTSTLALSKGRLPEEFLRGCGLADWEIEAAKLHNPDLTPNEVSEIQYRVFDLRAKRPIEIAPVFVSYSWANAAFVDRLGEEFDDRGIRYWRDRKDAEAGPLDKVIERGIHLNPTVILVLSEASVSSPWVEYEVDTAVELSRKLGRHVLCPVALDDSWTGSLMSGQLSTQIKKYNVLPFPAEGDDALFQTQLRKLLGGLQLHYARKES